MIRQISVWFVWGVSLFWSSIACAFVSTAASGQSSFLALSDIHFDPFIACQRYTVSTCPLALHLRDAPVSAWRGILQAAPVNTTYYQDSDAGLVLSALQAAKGVGQTDRIHFVVVLGDFLAHHLRYAYIKYTHDFSRSGYQAFITKTLTFLTNELQGAFPNKDVYCLLGNNDSYHGDYYAETEGPFVRLTANIWASLIHDRTNRAVMLHDYAEQGYYAVTVPGQPSLRLLMLNSVLFSSKVRGKQAPLAAQKELHWLQQQLQAAKAAHQHVFIAMHIPHGIDVYSSLRLHFFRIVELWDTAATNAFEALLKEYAGIISGVFSGHLHADWMQVVRFENMNEIPMLGIPAISPIFGSNPGFKVVTYMLPTGLLTDFVTYYDPLDGSRRWQKEYLFSAMYHPHCKRCPLLQGMHALTRVGPLATHYTQFYALGRHSQPISQHFNPYYWCAVHETQPEPFKRCIASGV